MSNQEQNSTHQHQKTMDQMSTGFFHTEQHTYMKSTTSEESKTNGLQNHNLHDNRNGQDRQHLKKEESTERKCLQKKKMNNRVQAKQRQ